ncbi:hypothetical protein BGZ60DRAFT_535248 [Tricladium varicosporioides]|nr:hypothetical protein BGZ60DRAFT_535248 [Hymenoscyphus varicosporioides]
MTQSKYTITIIGAGIAGPVLALTILSNPSLSKLYVPILFEKQPAPSTTSSSVDWYTPAVGAAVALTSNALFPLYELGLREELDKISCETERIKIWRTGMRGEGKYLNQIVNPGWKADLGTNLRVVERKDLRDLLLSKITELGGEVRYERKLLEVNREASGKIMLTFEDGIEEGGDLVVGADGLWSKVRKCIVFANKDPAQKEAPESRWMAIPSGSDGFYGVSEKFQVEDAECKPGDTHWIMLDRGVASTWALPGGKQFWTISLSSSYSTEKYTGLQRKSEVAKVYHGELLSTGYTIEETKETLKKHEDVWHPVAGSFKNLFERTAQISRTPIAARAWKAGDIGGANCVVIGDASRVMMPSSGQGACFGIEDATILAKHLLNHPPTISEDGLIDFQTCISKHVNERAPRNERMTTQSYWTGVVGLADRWWWRWIRDLGTAWMPMSGDPKVAKELKDPMGWLYDVRYKVEIENKEPDELLK